MGTTKVTEDQIKGIKRYLLNFDSLSVREEQSKQVITELLGNKCCVTIDPVFLLSAEQWDKCMGSFEKMKQYLIVYMLEKDMILLRYAKRYADLHNLDIYEIHPIRENVHKDFKQLDNVGPKEFVGLIRNAECICTNSFHALSFAIIYNKKCLHIPNPKSPTRTVSLLQMAGIMQADIEEEPLYEFNMGILNKLMPLIEFSKIYLQNAIFAKT